MAEIIFLANDNIIMLAGMKNVTTDSYINDATVTVTLVDPDGVDVPGVVDMEMPYVTDSDGDYTALLVDTLDLDSRRIYLAKVTADGGDGLKWYGEIDCEVLVRKS